MNINYGLQKVLKNEKNILPPAQYAHHVIQYIAGDVAVYEFFYNGKHIKIYVRMLLYETHFYSLFNKSAYLGIILQINQ